MDYSYGQKLAVTAKLEIEIKGRFPASQPLQINHDGEELFNVSINGHHVYLKKSILDAIVASNAQTEPEEIAEKPKRGRPAKE